jgi:hypothetical protein
MLNVVIWVRGILLILTVMLEFNFLCISLHLPTSFTSRDELIDPFFKLLEEALGKMAQIIQSFLNKKKSRISLWDKKTRGKIQSDKT